ncbi:MAG: Wzz/FepE/Etk N-terminal domain-containing protein [Cytophagaceae bacterium]|jgi:uncharacterized protein involved in exopolysaccharide biosynthesis|nr:Wzz/FepE/Etk N-terminal domain-containing protein [Cytophagaceae bacterium]
MTQAELLKRGLMPAIKGLPLIVLFNIGAILLLSKTLLYTTPAYESTAKLKLDDISQNFTSSNLYKDFDVFSSTNKILTEIEVLKSPILLEKASKNLGMQVSFFRNGLIKNTELYKDCPFTMEYQLLGEEIVDIPIQLEVSKEQIHLHYEIKDKKYEYHTAWNKKILTPHLSCSLKKNESLLSERPSLKVEDFYTIVFNSKSRIQKEIIGKNLEIHEIDKDIPIIRISFKHPVAGFSSDFVKALMQAYLQDYLESKTSAANQTVAFIEAQLHRVSNELKDAEINLENYRNQHQILNTKIEVETGLKKLSELSIQRANLQMTASSLDTLDRYLQHPKANFLEQAPNFDAHGGLLFSEMMKRLKLLQSEKLDLLSKYTSDHERIKSIDQKINDLIVYIKENIHNSRNSIRIQLQEIDRTLYDTRSEYSSIPEKEKNMIILERNFYLLQEVHNFLIEKRTEASIASAATTTFHRILQDPQVSKAPVYPNKPFLILVGAFLATILALVLIYAREFLHPYLRFPDQIERLSALPLALQIPDKKNTKMFSASLFKLSHLLNPENKKISIAVTSSLGGEGKTTLALELCNTFNQLGHQVVYINLNETTPFTAYDGHLEDFEPGQPKGLVKLTSKFSGPEYLYTIKNFLENKIVQWHQYASVIIVDAPSLHPICNHFPLHTLANTILYVLRENKSKLSDLDIIAQTEESEYSSKKWIVYNQSINTTTSTSSSQAWWKKLERKCYPLLRRLVWN